MSPSLDVMVVNGCLLLIDIEDYAVLPPMPLDAYPTLRNPGSPYKSVGGPNHCDGKHTTDISTYTEVGLLPLGGKAADQAFQRGFHLGTHQAVH